MPKENIEEGVEVKGKVKNTGNASKPEPKVEQRPSTSDEINELRREIQVLRSSVRQDKLSQADKQFKGEEPVFPTGFLKKLDGKLIVMWYGIDDPGSKATQELIYQNENVVGERLIGHYVTIDGEDIICDIGKFTRSNKLEYFDKVNSYGEDWIISFHNPELKEKYTNYKINVKFVNP